MCCECKAPESIHVENETQLVCMSRQPWQSVCTRGCQVVLPTHNCAALPKVHQQPLK